MAPGLPRAILKNGLNSSGFVRLLTELTNSSARADKGSLVGTQVGTGTEAGAAAKSKQSFAERLALWLDWTDAIALAATLPRETSARLVADRSAAASSTPAVVGEFVRLRRQLADAILADAVFQAGPTGLKRPNPTAVPALAAVVEFAPYRRACLGHQRAMAAGIVPLRDQVRQALAALSPALGQLAAIDAVLDQALADRERQLLSKVPVLLEKHFDRLRRAQGVTGLQAPESAPPWLAAYGRDMQQVLLAELDLRLQPIEGMMEAMGHEITRLQ